MNKALNVTLFCIVVSLFLFACKKNNTKALPTDFLEQPLETVSPADSDLVKAFTKEQVMNIFTNEIDHSNHFITECVLAEDMAYDLTGIVQYTDEKGNPCYLAFVKDSWSYPVDLDAEKLYVISDDSVLNYHGNGVVTLSLKDPENDVIFDYTVEYSCNATDTNIKITSSERK